MVPPSPVIVPNTTVHERQPTNLTGRLVSTAVGIPIILFFVFVEGPPGLTLLPMTVGVAGCALIGAWEYFHATRQRGFQPSDRLAFLAIIFLQVAVWLSSIGRTPVFLPVLAGLLALSVVVHQVFRRSPDILANIGITYLGIVYVGWLFSYLIFLRALPGTVAVPLGGLTLPETARGAWLVLYVMAVTWSTDTGAFFIGQRWGKRLLAPLISPAKTVEGAIGGWATGVLMSLAWGTWIGIPAVHCVVLGVLLGTLAHLGDLCESALKRELGVKDFGRLLPGMGGMLDRFDSIFFTAPVAYYYLALLYPPF
ncbi:MAG: phosphatidate cytidylyltransferase [Armatimonadaceae bacterium]